MKQSILFIFAFFFSVILCCSSEEEMPEIISPQEKNGVITDFPNQIGSQWRYFYYDSLANQSDTVIVTIVGDTIDNDNKKATIWQYRYSTLTDTQYVYIAEDTAIIYDNLTTPWSYIKFVFPLKIGENWTYGFYSFTIIDSVSLTIAAGYFENCYIIKQSGGILNQYAEILWWFVPEIGVIRKDHREYGFGFVNNYWELIGYHLTK